ncbi:MAG TPA: nucleotidyl transferase AbiEii/AbiGii toxin family protein [Polyangia bacterium]|nr:nucleotidyl transferase AbiEii/AbiGii toxin family protein [Polyangia bacterium]
MAASNLKAEVLDEDKKRVIRLQAHLVREGKFFLAGGTGLGLRLGHRLSDDIDWFTPTPFEAKTLIARLNSLPEKPHETVQHGAHTVRAYYDRPGTSEKLETSFITYAQVPAHPEPAAVGGTEFPVADISLLAAMKTAALHDRGARRDFIDVHAISSLPGWRIPRLIERVRRQLPLQGRQIALALTYFVDAEKESMPRGCKVSWEQVKKDLQRGVQEWERQRDRGIDR